MAADPCPHLSTQQWPLQEHRQLIHPMASAGNLDAGLVQVPLCPYRLSTAFPWTSTAVQLVPTGRAPLILLYPPHLSAATPSRGHSLPQLLSPCRRKIQERGLMRG